MVGLIRRHNCKSELNVEHSNVIAIDYRGFGDSSGVPSEEGLLIDARTVWDYVVESIKTSRSSSTSATSLDHLKPEEMVILAGQSLGTGVVSGLAGKLADEGEYRSPIWAR